MLQNNILVFLVVGLYPTGGQRSGSTPEQPNVTNNKIQREEFISSLFSKEKEEKVSNWVLRVVTIIPCIPILG